LGRSGARKMPPMQDGRLPGDRRDPSASRMRSIALEVQPTLGRRTSSAEIDARGNPDAASEAERPSCNSLARWRP
jgi:hypothetical protein